MLVMLGESRLPLRESRRLVEGGLSRWGRRRKDIVQGKPERS